MGEHPAAGEPAPIEQGRLRLSLAQLRYVAELAGTALPAELTALADAAECYDGQHRPAGERADCGVDDLVTRGVVTRDAAGTVTAADRVRASLRLLGTPDVAVDVRGRVGQRSTLASCAIGGTACVSVSVAGDGAVELTSLPASGLADELPRLVPALSADPDGPDGPGQGTLRAQVRRGSPDGPRLGQVTWVANGTGWQAVVPEQGADGRPGVRLTPRVPADLAADLAPLLHLT